jgi:hypothetical protein
MTLNDGDDSDGIQENLNNINRTCGTAADDRKHIINSAVKDIINNIVSSRTRVLLSIMNKGSDASPEDYKRLFVMNRNDFENEMKNPKYGDIDRMYYIMQSDPSKMHFVRDKEKDFIVFIYKFKEHVHDLIKLRNKIFATQYEFSLVDNPKNWGLETRNVAKFLEFSKSLEDKEEYSVYNFFKVSRRSPNQKKIKFNRNNKLRLGSYDTDEIIFTDSELENEVCKISSKDEPDELI